MSVRIYAKEESGIEPYQVMRREDILNTLTSDATDKALSAAQGRALANHTHALTSANLTDTLPVNKGGIGATTGSDALENLGYVEKTGWMNL